MLGKAAPNLVLVEAGARPKVGHLGDEALGDQHVVRLQIAVDQGFAARLLVVEVSEARRDALHELEVRERPVVIQVVRTCRHQQLFERPSRAELEHDA